MLILLGVSTALAVVTPGARDPDPQEETTSPTGPSGDTGTGGNTGGGEPDDPEAEDPNLAVVTVETGKLRDPDEGSKPDKQNGSGSKGAPLPVAKAEAAGRLVLTVETGGPANVSIPAFGQVGVATKYAPAVFDLIMPEKAGTFSVVDADSGATLAEIKTKG